MVLLLLPGQLAKVVVFLEKNSVILSTIISPIFPQSADVSVLCVCIVYLILPSCDIPKASGAQSLLQLPGPTALLLLRGDSLHGLLSWSYTQCNK